MKIAKGIKIDGPERKSAHTSPQKAWAEICSKAKRLKKFGLVYQHKNQAQGITSNKGSI
jgi:hypothetical protein